MQRTFPVRDHRHDPPVVRAEDGGVADHERRRLDVRVHAELPQRRPPRASRSNASTTPFFDVTMTRLPAIAGEEGFGAPPLRRQRTLPVAASSAYVSPSSVLT